MWTTHRTSFPYPPDGWGIHTHGIVLCTHMSAVYQSIILHYLSHNPIIGRGELVKVDTNDNLIILFRENNGEKRRLKYVDNSSMETFRLLSI